MFLLPLIILGFVTPGGMLSSRLADEVASPPMTTPISAECSIATTTLAICQYEICESEVVAWSPIDEDDARVDADTCGLCFCVSNRGF